MSWSVVGGGGGRCGGKESGGGGGRGVRGGEGGRGVRGGEGGRGVRGGEGGCCNQRSEARGFGAIFRQMLRFFWSWTPKIGGHWICSRLFLSASLSSTAGSTSRNYSSQSPSVSGERVNGTS